MARCPYSHTSDALAEADSCVQGCIDASFSKDGTPQDFFLKDTAQCRMNHAKIAIKEGPLTNSNHCLHASLEGPERCVSDDTALVEAATFEAGKQYLYYISPTLEAVGNDISKRIQVYVASVTYLLQLRGRLFSAFPGFDDYEGGRQKKRFLHSKKTKKAPPDTKQVHCEGRVAKKFRTPDATCNNLDYPLMGSTDMLFSRNLKPSKPHENGDAAVADVASILKRPLGEPKPETLAPFNQLVSAWIQFMTHDWFQHDHQEAHQHSTKDGSPLHRNKVTHWWDASQIYGSSLDDESKVRVDNGRIHLDNNDELDYDENGVPRTGFGENFWVGLHVFHTIFAREHNYIVDSLSVAYPEMSSDDKYGTARNCVSIILAKIHTLEWTPTLLDNSVSTLGLHSNWYGLKNAVVDFFAGIPLGSLEETLDAVKSSSVMESKFDTSSTLQNTPFTMTEEFVGVYRMHPLLPDELDIDGQNFSLHDFSFKDTRKLTEKSNATEVFLQALSNTPARALSLTNYPYSLYDLNIPGRGTVNLAEIDLTRDRERNLPRYNDARRQLLLEPYTSLDDLTDNEEELQLLRSVYTDIEQVDLMVGCLVDKERPEGFAFGIVPYHIFIVIATRRLMSDRFFQEGLTEENYSPWGINYVKTESLQSILVRHFPDLDGVVPSNPFLNGWTYQ